MHWSAGTSNKEDLEKGLGPFKWVVYDADWQVIARGYASSMQHAEARAPQRADYYEDQAT